MKEKIFEIKDVIVYMYPKEIEDFRNIFLLKQKIMLDDYIRDII